MHNFIEKIIRILKSEPSYSLDKNINSFLLMQLSFRRGFSLLRGFFTFFVFKNILLGRNFNVLHKQLLYLSRGVNIEDNVTIDALSVDGVNLGDNVTIARFSIIQCTGVIKQIGQGVLIGKNSALGAFSFIGGQGGVVIGENVIMGPRVSIFSENHIYSNLDIPIRVQGTSRQGVNIEDDCWIGSGSIILDGVSIGKGCVVAAGSIVNKTVPPYSVVAGIPAKVIKKRDLG